MQPKITSDREKYLAALRLVIAHRHECESVWLKTEDVHETLHGKTVWKGPVEVFSLIHHPKAKHAYAWAHLDGKAHEKTRFVALLEVPPIQDAQTAVHASIIADSKRRQG
jgi:hypothetical protein